MYHNNLTIYKTFIHNHICHWRASSPVLIRVPRDGCPIPAACIWRSCPQGLGNVLVSGAKPTIASGTLCCIRSWPCPPPPPPGQSYNRPWVASTRGVISLVNRMPHHCLGAGPRWEVLHGHGTSTATLTHGEMTFLNPHSVHSQILWYLLHCLNAAFGLVMTDKAKYWWCLLLLLTMKWWVCWMHYGEVIKAIAFGLKILSAVMCILHIVMCNVYTTH